jgi:hypothetical protein
MSVHTFLQDFRLHGLWGLPACTAAAIGPEQLCASLAGMTDSPAWTATKAPSRSSLRQLNSRASTDAMLARHQRNAHPGPVSFMHQRRFFQLFGPPTTLSSLTVTLSGTLFASL